MLHIVIGVGEHGTAYGSLGLLLGVTNVDSIPHMLDVYAHFATVCNDLILFDVRHHAADTKLRALLLTMYN